MATDSADAPPHTDNTAWLKDVVDMEHRDPDWADACGNEESATKFLAHMSSLLSQFSESAAPLDPSAAVGSAHSEVAATCVGMPPHQPAEHCGDAHPCSIPRPPHVAPDPNTRPGQTDVGELGEVMCDLDGRRGGIQAFGW